ncbi:RING finger and CHY zinc finger domain-containing protein 1 [Drosophila persimilis]|uniref:RING finger and CHY zinc finger domain-containing protein 1 n=1 Tax=Drosophila persimilis TaxID=7234 RepID=UPI000F085C6E|nr:RING finger and CHY zinc finger domain-containing protein 1 [Drosophila persimilis]
MKNRQRQRRISLNESHNKYNHIDVQISTNTKEPNQVNLNSSSKLSSRATSLEAAAADDAPRTSPSPSLSPPVTVPVSQIAAATQQEQRLQLIMPPTIMTGDFPTYVKMRKSKSTPSLLLEEEPPAIVWRRHIISQPKTASEASETVATVDSSHCCMEVEPQQHEQFSRFTTSSGNNDSCNNKCSNATPTTPESLRFGCAHYKRRAMFVTPCCNKFYKCRFCHDENETHHFDRKTLTELICSECNTRQTVQEQCENCGVRFGKYTCLICNLFDDADKQQYHCHGCGICRIGGADNFFHCEVCNMCLPIQLKIDGHRCVENISRSHCPVCLGDIHTSRIPCHIPDCGHLLHKMCFDQLLASGHYTCPTCQTSLIDMTALWEYLDDQALRMPVTLKYENQRVHIFCNDCHKTCKTKFHFIGLKCVHCGAYNTTQDVKRRLSLVTDEPSSA